MDPQQRLLLEVSAEAVLAGHKTLQQDRAGVFVGIATSDYASLVKEHMPPGGLVLPSISRIPRP